MKPLIVFLHIPKCGGTSLNAVLRGQYPQHRTLKIYEHHRSAVESLARRAGEVDLVVGHVPYGLWGVAGDVARPIRYLTMVRRPVARILSLFHDIKRRESHYLHKPCRDLDLEAFVTADFAQHEVCNLQTRILAGAPHGRGYDQVPDTQVDFDSRELLDAALEHVDQPVFAGVGVLEQFDESILHWSKELGWRLPLYARKNVSSNPRYARIEDVPDAVVDEISRRNTLDTELYERVASSFPSDQFEHGWPRMKKHTFQLINTLYGAGARLKGALDSVTTS